MCQLVLGAGAVGLGNLKSIMAKHLAISSQCITFLLEELQFIKMHFDISGNQEAEKYLEKELEQIRMDFKNHREEIFKKLETMLSTIILKHFQSTLDRKYDEEEEIREENKEENNQEKKEEKKCSQYVKDIINVINQMHNAISGLLPQTHVSLIFREALNGVSLKAQEIYQKIEIKTSTGLKRYYIK